MSAALQLPFLWAVQGSSAAPRIPLGPARVVNASPIQSAGSLESAVNHIRKRFPPEAVQSQPVEPVVSYAFYRGHTERLIRRYLYASMMIGRAPSLLGECVDRGWASNRKVRTFEDALIFVLDVERCLKKLSKSDLQIISRVVVQENTQSEAAALLGLSSRSVYLKLSKALDRLTENLIKYDLLLIPD